MSLSRHAQHAHAGACAVCWPSLSSCMALCLCVGTKQPWHSTPCTAAVTICRHNANLELLGPAELPCMRPLLCCCCPLSGPGRTPAGRGSEVLLLWLLAAAPRRLRAMLLHPGSGPTASALDAVIQAPCPPATTRVRCCASNIGFIRWKAPLAVLVCALWHTQIEQQLRVTARSVSCPGCRSGAAQSRRPGCQT